MVVLGILNGDVLVYMEQNLNLFLRGKLRNFIQMPKLPLEE